MRNIYLSALAIPFLFIACKHDDDKGIKEYCYEEDTGYDDTGDTADTVVDTGETGDSAIDTGDSDTSNDTSLPADTADTSVVPVDDTGVETGTVEDTGGETVEDTGSSSDTAVPV